MSNAAVKKMVGKNLLQGFLKYCNRGVATQATFQVKPFKLHRIENGPSTEVTVTRDEALNLFEKMATIRRMEAMANSMYKEKAIRGFCHLYSGQEGVAVGIENAITPQDLVITAYRAHGWSYVRGVDPIGVLAELTGRTTGCAKGKGGSMHMYSPNFFGGNGIVGAQVPLGAGLAFALKYQNKNNVSIALYGDGAANQGQVFEAYNMAKLWKLPCIFVCENNGYGMGTSTSRSSASTDFYTRGDYVSGIWADGMDVLAIREATRFLVQECNAGNGPFVMEAETYRYSGHSMSDPGTSYRTREEIQEVRHNRDPITSFREKIIDANLATADELKAIESNIKQTIDEVAKRARTDPLPQDSEVTADIYVNPLETEIRGATPFEGFQHHRISTPWNV